MFQKKCSENNTRIPLQILYSRECCHLWDNLEKCGTVREHTNDNVISSMSVAYLTNILNACISASIVLLKWNFKIILSKNLLQTWIFSRLKKQIPFPKQISISLYQNPPEGNVSFFSPGCGFQLLKMLWECIRFPSCCHNNAQ